MLNNKLDANDLAEAQDIFNNLKMILPTPPGFDEEAMKSSVSWFKSSSTSFIACNHQMDRTSKILKKLGYDLLLLETDKLDGVLYEDEVQILTEAKKNEFRILKGVY